MLCSVVVCVFSFKCAFSGFLGARCKVSKLPNPRARESSRETLEEKTFFNPS